MCVLLPAIWGYFDVNIDLETKVLKWNEANKICARLIQAFPYLMDTDSGPPHDNCRNAIRIMYPLDEIQNKLV